ncbi:MAG: 4-hydroxy-3-methylbut-2-en-1-yl diphosphate synthase [Dysgonamonadaceae bacterium]|jgi:(E)-4-hydroxy-3-methylbut-2-enyl-diphosphate synthase|nr:4-hydroxy-3-methylbut-2-en-1-yl diphosphate synthase [Dysgonamonadaceae bacterium]
MYKRRKTSVVFIGNTPVGGENPVRIQSMTNTSTLDTEGSIRQSIRIIEAGGEYVRLTAQGVREAENLRPIKEGLRALGYYTPLVADIHFNPKAAESAAKIVEKVRINPGNFADPVKTFKTFEYSDEEYRQELEKIKERFIPFLNICKEYKTAIRIGVNHGSLSDRIMSRYGDTPHGMVESCMEFLRICVEEFFSNVVISIKASNTFVMVETVRLLVERMNKEGMAFPLHLGVTEAGDGEDGRIKSAVGIGALLVEGIGDTIRVSLSENPEAEIPVAHLLVDYIREKEKLPLVEKPQDISPATLKTVSRRKTIPFVISDRSATTDYSVHSELVPEYIYAGKQIRKELPDKIPVIVDFVSFSPGKNTFPLFTMKEKEAWLTCQEDLQFFALKYSELNTEILCFLKKRPETVVLIYSTTQNHIYEQKALIYTLKNFGINNPVVLREVYDEQDLETFQIKSAVDCGSFFLDNLADGIMLGNKKADLRPQSVDACGFGILQASGRRISKTEYISCPSCGRTLFDLQTTLKKVKSATPHLKGLKIAVMGCIVNGPGEMADADYGYVGAGAGKINLYKGKECVLKNIPEENAVNELIKLIKKSST